MATMGEPMRDGCILCGTLVHSTLSNAHGHARDGVEDGKTFRLCLSCHRMYDHDIVSTVELVQAERRWEAGFVPDATALHRLIEADLAAGTRRVDKAVQHKFGARKAALKIRRRAAARKAVATRRQRQKAAGLANGETGKVPPR